MKKSYILGGLFLVLLGGGGYFALTHFFSPSSYTKHMQVATERIPNANGLISLNTQPLNPAFEHGLAILKAFPLPHIDHTGLEEIYTTYFKDYAHGITGIASKGGNERKVFIALETNHPKILAFLRDVQTGMRSKNTSNKEAIQNSLREISTHTTLSKQIDTALSKGEDIGTYMTHISWNNDTTLEMNVQGNIATLLIQEKGVSEENMPEFPTTKVISNFIPSKDQALFIATSRRALSDILPYYVMDARFSEAPKDTVFGLVSLQVPKNEALSIGLTFLDANNTPQNITDLIETFNTALKETQDAGGISSAFEKVRISADANNTTVIIQAPNGFLEILENSIRQSLVGYFERSRDVNRQAGLRNIVLALSSYVIDHAHYPSVPKSGCVADLQDTLHGYILSIPTDPQPGFGVSGCEDRGGYGYALMNGGDSYVLSARMELEGDANFDGAQWKNIHTLAIDSGYLRHAGINKRGIPNAQGESQPENTVIPKNWYYIIIN